MKILLTAVTDRAPVVPSPTALLLVASLVFTAVASCPAQAESIPAVHLECDAGALERAQERFLAARIFYDKQQYQDAIRENLLALEHCPDLRVLFNLAGAYLKHGMKQEAREWYERYIRQLRAEIAQREKTPDDGQQRNLEPFLKLERIALAQIFKIAEDYRTQGNRLQALRAYQRYLALPLSDQDKAAADEPLQQLEQWPDVRHALERQKARDELRHRRRKDLALCQRLQQRLRNSQKPGKRLGYKLGLAGALAAAAAGIGATAWAAHDKRRFERDKTDAVHDYQERTGAWLAYEDVCTDAANRIVAGQADSELPRIVDACEAGRLRSRIMQGSAIGTAVFLALSAGLAYGILKQPSEIGASRAQWSLQPALSKTGASVHATLRF